MATFPAQARTPTLLVVHAHPDDEATSTGGILARYGADGIRTVVVTCTNGECGDGPGGVKPGEPGHDPATVAATRRAELEQSCSLLGVSEVELLGFRDSGMDGWPQNDLPDSFCKVPAETAAARLVPVIERFRPDVVVTYDADGFYGHPDHVQAHRVTLAALAMAESAARLFFPVIPSSARAKFTRLLSELGEEPASPEAEAAVGDARSPAGAARQARPDPGAQRTEWSYRSMDYPDGELSALVDCRAWVKAAYDALAAHRSQSENLFMLRLGPGRFAEVFGVEAFAPGSPAAARPASGPLGDLFTGLR